MAAYIGTSGFGYKEWKPDFYPATLPQSQFLAHYASRFNAVEVDSTFYRMPTAQSLDAWMQATPTAFRFAIKAPRRITHSKPLTIPSEPLAYLASILPRLGDRLGALLFQLPPYVRCDIDRLSAFLDNVPERLRAVFEFRHPSWFVEPAYALLERHRASLCIHDSDDGSTPVRLTAGFAYVRLRKQSYSDEDREAWRGRFRQWLEQGIDVFAFIKHKDNPRAPAVALAFAESLAEPALL
jgi:uncharacterized protein YecE (DUF72 family)